MQKIFRYTVWDGKKEFRTNNLQLAEKKAALSNATLFELVRFEGLKRLQRIYLRLQAAGKLPANEDLFYPELVN